MPEELKELIEKIHREGVKAANNKAKNIEQSAASRAGSVVEKAEKSSEEIIRRARAEAARIKESGEASLQQAARNLMISLRKEINTVLNKVIALEVREALDTATMARIIISLAKSYKEEEAKDIIISLSKGDRQKMEKGFLARLKTELKKGIELKASDDIGGGFIISYDGGRSHYDFTDKALAEYIGLYLRPKLADILKGASSSGKKK